MAALCLQFLKANGKDSISKNSKGAFEFAAVEDGQSGDGPPPQRIFSVGRFVFPVAVKQQVRNRRKTVRRSICFGTDTPKLTSAWWERSGERQQADVQVHTPKRFRLNQSGRRRRAIVPVAPSRLMSARVPPWFSMIWRQSTRPMPEPDGLVVKKGTKRFWRFAIPGPSS